MSAKEKTVSALVVAGASAAGTHKVIQLRDGLRGVLTVEEVQTIEQIVRESLGERAVQYFCHLDDGQIVLPLYTSYQILTEYDEDVGVEMTHWIAEASKYIRTRSPSFHTGFHQAFIRGLRNAIIDLTPKWWEMVKSGEMRTDAKKISLNRGQRIRDIRVDPEVAIACFLEKILEDQKRKGDKIELITVLRQNFRDIIIPNFRQKKGNLSIHDRVETIRAKLGFIKTNLLFLVTYLQNKAVSRNESEIFLINPRFLAKGIVHAPSGRFKGAGSWLNWTGFVEGGDRSVNRLALEGEFAGEIQTLAKGGVVSVRDMASHQATAKGLTDQWHPLMNRYFKAHDDWESREDHLVSFDLSDETALTRLDQRAHDFSLLFPLISELELLREGMIYFGKCVDGDGEITTLTHRRRIMDHLKAKYQSINRAFEAMQVPGGLFKDLYLMLSVNTPSDLESVMEGDDGRNVLAYLMYDVFDSLNQLEDLYQGLTTNYDQQLKERRDYLKENKDKLVRVMGTLDHLQCMREGLSSDETRARVSAVREM